MTINVKMDREDCEKLERLHYMTESKANLLSRLSSNEASYSPEAYDKIMNDYYETFREYSLYKEEIDSKYRPKEHEKDAKSWRADFAKQLLIYEV